MKTTKTLPFRALNVREMFMYEDRCWVKLSSSSAAYLGSTEPIYIHPNAPVEA